MAGGKKKSKNLLLLLIGMVILIGAYVWLVQYNNKKEKSASEAADEGVTSIVTLKADSIDTIYFKNSKNEMTLKMGEDGKWHYTKDETFPVRQTNAENMKNALTNITSSRTITEGSKGLADYGLLEPAVQVTVTTKDGMANSLSLGVKAPVDGGYYARLNDSKEVYIVTAAFYNYFNFNLAQMTEVEAIPTITAANITHLAVESKDKPAFEVVYDAEKSADLSGFTNWTMLKPYDTPIPADGDALTTLFGNYTALSYLDCVDYKGEDLSRYGLLEPYGTVSINYYEETAAKTDNKAASKEQKEEENTSGEDAQEEQKTVKTFYSYDLFIGNKDVDGNYYVKSKESDAVYTMSADTVDKLIEVDSYSNVYHYINLINIEAVKEITINTGGKDYVLSVEKIKETKDDKETEVSKYYYNNKEAEETSFKELFQALIAPVTDREIQEGANSKMDQTPIMTVTYKLSTREKPLVIEYKPYDESFYIVNSDGIEYFLTDARTINDLAEKIKNYQPMAEQKTE